MHLDNILKGLQLSFSFKDLLNDLSIEMKSNVNMRMLVDEEDFVLNDEFALKMQFKVRGEKAHVLN